MSWLKTFFRKKSNSKKQDRIRWQDQNYSTQDNTNNVSSLNPFSIYNHDDNDTGYIEDSHGISDHSSQTDYGSHGSTDIGDYSGSSFDSSFD